METRSNGSSPDDHLLRDMGRVVHEHHDDQATLLPGRLDWSAAQSGFLAVLSTPLGTSEGRSKSELVEATGNEFVDNLLDGLEYDVEIKPQGWIAYLNLSYAF